LRISTLATTRTARCTLTLSATTSFRATSHLGLLHIIQGLNEKHSSIGMHLKCGRPFLAFLEAHPDLLLEKLTLANRSSTLVTAFTASRGTATTPPTGALSCPGTTAALRFRGHVVRGQDKAPWPQASTANVVPAMGRAASSSLALQLPALWLALAQLLLGPGHPSSTWLWSIQMWPGNRRR